MNAFELNLRIVRLTINDRAANWRCNSFTEIFAFFENAVRSIAAIVHFKIGVLSSRIDNKISTLIKITDRSAFNLVHRRVRIGSAQSVFKGCGTGKEGKNEKQQNMLPHSLRITFSEDYYGLRV